MRRCRRRSSLAAVGLAACGGGDRELVGAHPTIPSRRSTPSPCPTSADGGAPFEFRAPADGLLVVYFGYTNCPDVCPTTMADLATALDDIGDDAERGRRRDGDRRPGPRHCPCSPTTSRASSPAPTPSPPTTRPPCSPSPAPFGVSYEVRTAPDGEIEVGHSSYLFAVDDTGQLVITWPVGGGEGTPGRRPRGRPPPAAADADDRGRPRARSRSSVASACRWSLAPAGVVFADPAGPTDYRTTVTSIDPGGRRASRCRVVGGDSFLRLVVDPGIEVVVLGYQQEPYLRIRADGVVEENQRSPATYLNADRYGTGTPPAGADPTLAPNWLPVGTGGAWAWHDHRAHWMSPDPPAGGPRPATQIQASTVPLLVDGTAGRRRRQHDVARRRRRGCRSPSARRSAAPPCCSRCSGGPVWPGRCSRCRVAAGGIGWWQFRSLPAETGPLLVWWLLPAVAAGSLARRRSLLGRRLVSYALVLLAALELAVWVWLRRDGAFRAIIPTDAPSWLDRGVMAATGGRGRADRRRGGRRDVPPARRTTRDDAPRRWAAAEGRVRPPTHRPPSPWSAGRPSGRGGRDQSACGPCGRHEGGMGRGRRRAGDAARRHARLVAGLAAASLRRVQRRRRCRRDVGRRPSPRRPPRPRPRPRPAPSTVPLTSTRRRRRRRPRHAGRRPRGDRRRRRPRPIPPNRPASRSPPPTGRRRRCRPASTGRRSTPPSTPRSAPPDAEARVRSIVVVQGGADRLRALPPARRARRRDDVVLGGQELHVGDRRDARRRRRRSTLDEHPPRPEWPRRRPAPGDHAAPAAADVQRAGVGRGVRAWQRWAVADARVARRGRASWPRSRWSRAGHDVRVLDRHDGARSPASPPTRSAGATAARRLPPRAAARSDRHHDRRVLTDGGGCCLGGLGMDMTTRDFARFGLLFLRGGCGTASRSCRRRGSTRSACPAPTNPQYGLHWWLRPDGRRVRGRWASFGQRIVVVPGRRPRRRHQLDARQRHRRRPAGEPDRRPRSAPRSEPPARRVDGCERVVEVVDAHRAEVLGGDRAVGVDDQRHRQRGGAERLGELAVARRRTGRT